MEKNLHPESLAKQVSDATGRVLPFCSLGAHHHVTTPSAVGRRNCRCGAGEMRLESQSLPPVAGFHTGLWSRAGWSVSRGRTVPFLQEVVPGHATSALQASAGWAESGLWNRCEGHYTGSLMSEEKLPLGFSFFPAPRTPGSPGGAQWLAETIIH